MCIVCKERNEQSTMLRLQCKNNDVLLFDGYGRSFYICKSCINSVKLGKIIQKICKIEKNKIQNIMKKIKEMKFYEN